MSSFDVEAPKATVEVPEEPDAGFPKTKRNYCLSSDGSPEPRGALVEKPWAVRLVADKSDKILRLEA